MRPVRRRTSPRATDFDDYDKAKPDLLARLGFYCSYCERHIPTGLHVEHIQPKGLPQYLHLIGRWENFLLACINCNSTKKDRDVNPEQFLLPDRDNTFSAFEYSPDGKVVPRAELTPALLQIAERTLWLTGLDKDLNEVLDQNGERVAIDRVEQRRQLWGVADALRQDILDQPADQALRRSLVANARANGHFSIWMAVFSADADMKNRLIDAFAGTRESGCFDPATGAPVIAPNPDGLPSGSKV
jgi:uncharacterized protein (TIGR02646 family)